MKITILWSSLTSYSVAFFRELSLSQKCKIQLIYQKAKNEAPYNHFDLSFCVQSLEDSSDIKNRLEKLVKIFNPNCVLMCSWNFSHYMQLCKKLRKEKVYIISAMDNQWQGTIKQWLGVITSKWFLKSSIDNFLVAGDRQANFARKLGYNDVLYGLYAADIDKFSINRVGERWPNRFLFIGRLVKKKGVFHLIQAYKNYRLKIENPWELLIVGTGPLRTLLEEVHGINYLGFIQPENLPTIMKSAGCFILPSIWEPWGVVIQEACAAGLPIVATYQCGATTDFVKDGINGFIISAKVEKIVEAMLKISKSSISELEEMSKISLLLANLRTPYKLAQYFRTNIESLIYK